MSNKTQRRRIREALTTPKPRDPVVRSMIVRNQKAGVHASNSKRARLNKYKCRGKVQDS